MRNRAKRIVGWIADEAMSPEQAAHSAIAKAQEVLGRAPGVVHIDTVTGKLTLFADRDAPIEPGCTVRGIRFDSDPDLLAEEFREAMAETASKPRKSAGSAARNDPLGPRHESKVLEAVALVRAGMPVEKAAKQVGLGRTTIYRWIARYPVEDAA